jgi:hypothetical protein
MRSWRPALPLLMGMALMLCGGLAAGQEGCRFLLDCESRKVSPPTSTGRNLTIQSAPFFDPQFQAVGLITRQALGSVQIELQSGGFYKSSSRPEGSWILRGVSIAFCHSTAQGWSGRLWIPVVNNMNYLIDSSHSFVVNGVKIMLPVPPDDPTLSEHWICIMGIILNPSGAEAYVYAHAPKISISSN